MRERLAEVGGAGDARPGAAAARDARPPARRRRSWPSASATLAAVEAELRQRRTPATERKQLSLDLFSTEAEKRGACERIRERQALARASGATRREQRLERAGARARRAGRTAARRRRSAAAGSTLERGRGAPHAERGATPRIAALRGRAPRPTTPRCRGSAAGRGGRVAAQHAARAQAQLRGRLRGRQGAVRTTPARAGADSAWWPTCSRSRRATSDALEASLGEASAFVLVDGARRALRSAVARCAGCRPGAPRWSISRRIAAGTLPRASARARRRRPRVRPGALRRTLPPAGRAAARRRGRGRGRDAAARAGGAPSEGGCAS